MNQNNSRQEDALNSDEFYEHYRFTADKGQQPLRIDKFLMNRIENASRSKIQAAAHEGCIYVNDKIVKPNYKVKALDEIKVLLPEPPRDTELVAENIPINIVYEDESLLVINKEAGMVVHPGFNNYTGTLVNALVYHFDKLPSHEANQGRPGLVHRLDKDTTGLLVIAKTEKALTHLAKQFYLHSIERKYVALAWGDIAEDEGVIDTYLMRHQKDRRIVTATDDEEKGKHAITHYKVLQRLGYVTLVECRLETGRTHQIRAHFKHIGHPLFNDAAYGGDKILKGTVFTKYKQFVNNCFKILNRQALHAKSLGFIHPESGKEMFFESDLPEDLRALLSRWTEYAKHRQME